MARRARIWHPGGYFHVIQRGVARRPLFTSDDERLKFLEFVEVALDAGSHRLHGWCLMDNHVHLAMQHGDTGLGDFVKRSFGRCAQWFNVRHRRVGHLYQERYKSVLVASDAYLKQLVAYIHLNPVKVGLARTPDGYTWSSHRSYLGRSDRWAQMLTTDAVLGQFGRNRRRARVAFDKFVRAGMDREPFLDFDRGNTVGMDALIPDGYRSEVLATGAQRQAAAAELELDTAIETVCRQLDVKPEALMDSTKDRQAAKARNLLALLGRESGAWSLKTLANRVNRDYSTLSRGAGRVAKQLQSDPQLAKTWKALWDK